MTTSSRSDLDYLAARLHGRRSRMAEAQRLFALARLGTVDEMVRSVAPDAAGQTVRQFQAGRVAGLAQEIEGLLPFLPARGIPLIRALLERVLAEEAKVRFRVEPGVLPQVPGPGWLRDALPRALDTWRANPRPFFFEATLDREYLRMLLARTVTLPRQEREAVAPMVLQEADLFHLRLVARGRFGTGLDPALLRPLHVEGTLLPDRRFAAMLRDPSLAVAAGRALGRALDEVPGEPVEPAAVEALGWQRFFRMANRAFRSDPIGLGAVAGYVGVRRVEVANLITVSEGIRAAIDEAGIRARLTPRG